MGCCISSAGAYPGNTRVAKPAYQPSDDEYKQVDKNTAVAQAHFVTCPGGNALKLVGKPNRAEGDAGGMVGSEGLAKYISGEFIDGDLDLLAVTYLGGASLELLFQTGFYLIHYLFFTSFSHQCTSFHNMIGWHATITVDAGQKLNNHLSDTAGRSSRGRRHTRTSTRRTDECDHGARGDGTRIHIRGRVFDGHAAAAQGGGPDPRRVRPDGHGHAGGGDGGAVVVRTRVWWERDGDCRGAADDGAVRPGLFGEIGRTIMLLGCA